MKNKAFKKFVENFEIIKSKGTNETKPNKKYLRHFKYEAEYTINNM